MILWLVKCKWARGGQLGRTKDIVVAQDSIEALRIAWECEDLKDLRDVSIKWLGPEECIFRRSTLKTNRSEKHSGYS